MTSPNIQNILELLIAYDCNLVSFGLAPNPSGFCFEVGEETTSQQAKELTDALMGLSAREEEDLRKLVF
jgi:hypothetical protein